MKEYFTAEIITKLKQKKKHEEDEINVESNKVSDVTLYRDYLKVDYFNNDKWLTNLFKYRVVAKMKQRAFNALKKNYEHEKFCKHNARILAQRRQQGIMRKVVDAWRVQVHMDYKQKQILNEPNYYLQRKTEVIDEWDNLIEGLKGYIEQLQNEIKVEVNAKSELIQLYERTMNGSIQQFHKANDFVETQINDYRQTVNYDTFGRAGETKAGFKSTDINRVTLTQLHDPEDE